MRTATAAQMKDLDRVAIEERGIPSVRLMEAAARGVADEVMKTLAGVEHPRVAILCGPGNNGGDGVAAARFLLERGVEVRAFLVGDRDKLTADTAEMEARLNVRGGVLEDGLPEEDWLESCHAVVDALIGIGLHAQVRGAAADAIALLERHGAGKAVAVDIASGVDADTGADLGNRCRYVKTVTFTSAKPGHFLGHGGTVRGELVVVDIGIPPDLAAGTEGPFEAVDGALVRSLLPRRDPLGHKGTFGKVHILGGSVGYTGAPVLAAGAALRTGSGLVSLSVPRPIYEIAAVKCDEAMPFPLPAGADGTCAAEALPPALERLADKDACLIGPGLGRSAGAEAVVCGLLERVEIPMVLDADGLNIAAAHMDKLDGRRGRVTILTPHEGEFLRLGGDLSGGDRVAAARAFARAHGCILVLKGPGTVTALPDGRAFVNGTGNSGMAKGGSGDILAGMILSLLGQGLSPEWAAVAAVWLHGRAGDLAAEEKGERGMLPTDLLERIPQAILEVTG